MRTGALHLERGCLVGGRDPAAAETRAVPTLGAPEDVVAGVDRDDATRDKVRELADRMTELSMTFSRTVQDDVRRVTVDDPNDLRGLPADYLTRHGVTEANGQLVASGEVVITTDPPEMSPVMSYAASGPLRRKLYLQYNDRGYPGNKQVLLDLLASREEMAEVLQELG